MSTTRNITRLFVFAAVYNASMGAVFLFAGGPVLERFGVVPPSHPSFIHFPAALLIVFAVMFAAVAAHPVRNRNLIPYGILLNLSYCGLVLFHSLTGGLPNLWKPFAVVDFVLTLLFVWAWAALGNTRGASADASGGR